MMKSISIFSIILFSATLLNGQVLLSSKKFDAERIERLEVEGSFVQVNLNGVSGDRISVNGQVEGPKRYQGEIEIRTKLNGSTLVVWVERPNSINGNFDGEINIDVPKGTVVDAKNSSGSMYAKDLEAKDIDLRCSSGSLKVENIKGNISLKASSGSIKATGLMGNTIAKTSSGSLRIDNLNGNLEAKTSSGGLTLTGRIDGDVYARTSSGGIRLDRIKGSLDLQTSSGSIKGDYVELTGDSNFEATSGSINLNLENSLDNMSFNIRSSSGGIKVGDRRAEDHLTIRNGGLSVTARTSSGSISFR